MCKNRNCLAGWEPHVCLQLVSASPASLAQAHSRLTHLKNGHVSPVLQCKGLADRNSVLLVLYEGKFPA